MSGGGAEEAISELYEALVHGDGAAEPRRLAGVVARVPTERRGDPICKLADAVIARIGDPDAADAAHRAAADALVDDPAASCTVLASWIGVAMRRRDVESLLELRTRSLAVADAAASRALVQVIDAVGAVAFGRHAEVERMLVTALDGVVSPHVRGVAATVRALALQARGLLDASVAVLDADARALGSFDLAAELMRARAAWVAGEHARARSMVAHVVDEGRRRGRQHDADAAAATARLTARHDGDPPDAPRPMPNTAHVAAMVHLDDALALLPDRQAARAHLLAHPDVRHAAPEFLMVPFVLCPEWRDSWDAAAGADGGSDVFTVARALVDGGAATLDPWTLRNAFRPWLGADTVGRVAEPTETPPAVRLRVLGDVAVEIDGVLHSVRRSRVRALLVALALQRRMTRERLADVLWPDLEPAAGANNLRTTLTYARQVVPGVPLVHTDGPVASLAVPVDLWLLDQATATARTQPPGPAGRAAWRAAADLVHGAFAPSVSGGRWVEAAQSSIDTASVDVLLRAAGEHLEAAPADARRWADLARRIDPWSDRAVAVSVQAWCVEGDLTAARRELENLAGLLEELGVDDVPTLDTIAQRYAPVG